MQTASVKAQTKARPSKLIWRVDQSWWSMTCLGVSVKRWHWERWTKARQWRAYINLLQRLVRSSWLPRESNANARKDEVYGVCMKNSFLIARATFNSKIESCYFFFNCHKANHFTLTRTNWPMGLDHQDCHNPHRWTFFRIILWCLHSN